MRKEIVEQSELLDLKKRCFLLNCARSTLYYQSKPPINDDVKIMNHIREIYQQTPFYGYRRITVALRQDGFLVNHKKVQRLMRLAGMKAIYPGKRTTIRNPEHKIFPYLLRDLIIERPDQVWQVDITYIKMRQGFVYLVCLIDVFSRKIMGWKLSIFLDTESCLEALNRALHQSTPEIINSDQGSQFTSVAWVKAVTEGDKILISMDGKGRWADNVYIERLWRTIKYEDVFLNSYDTVDQARVSIGNFINFYNQKRFHQALNYHTPNDIYTLKTVPSKQQLFQKFALQNSAKQQKGEVVLASTAGGDQLQPSLTEGGVNHV
jgi:putative transposase